MPTSSVHSPIRSKRVGMAIVASLTFVWLEYLSTSHIPLFPSGMGCGPSINSSYLPLNSGAARVLIHIQPLLQFPLSTVQRVALRGTDGVTWPSGWRGSLLHILYPLELRSETELKITLAWITSLNVILQGIAIGVAVAVALAAGRLRAKRLRQRSA